MELQSLFNNKDYRIQITRQKFEELNKDLFLKLLGPIDEALQQADMSAESIDGIVLVGGSTRIPKIQEMLKKKFPRSSINKDINPDEAVAHGAAIQAAKLVDDRDCEALQEMTLLDVTPLSLGIETAGGLMSIVIPRNTTVPVTKTKIFSTHKDGQTAVRVQVYEGERPLTKENNLLGDFRLTGIQPKKSTKVAVAFNVDSNGILNVTAKEDGKEKTLGLTNQMEMLTKEEVQEMIQKANDLRQEDEKEKERVQAKVNLESLCLRYQSELRSSQATGRVPGGDRDKVFTEVAKVLSWLEINPGNPKEDYEKRYQKLHDTCEPIRHKIYDDSGSAKAKKEPSNYDDVD